MNNKLYTLQEVADYFRVDPRTVMAWEREGKITFIRLPKGNLIRVSQEELDRFTRMQTVGGR
jgi:excisionase family DNA binding protein